MKKFYILVILAAFILATTAIAAVTYGGVLGTPVSQGMNFTPGVIMHPPGCDVATDRTLSAGGLTLMVESTHAPTLHEPVCLHFVLTNYGSQPFPAYQYIMEMNITDGRGVVLYHQDWGIVSPPGQNFVLTTGNFWENGAYWYPGDSPTQLLPGAYHLVASLFLPGSSASAYRGNVLFGTTLDLNLGS